MTDTVVTLEIWYDRLFGNRYSLVYEGQRRITCWTEAEARAAAARHGWTVADEGDGLGDGR